MYEGKKKKKEQANFNNNYYNYNNNNDDFTAQDGHETSKADMQLEN